MCECGLTRRGVLTGLAAGSVVAALPVLAGARDPGHVPPVSAVTAEQALQRLKEGNARFVSGKSMHPNTSLARLQETVKDGQHPFVSVLSCADSRVPVELIFDQGVGDLFVIRVAGNVSDIDEIGTIEYGTGHLGTPLVLVLGHTKCGAVTAVVKGDKVGGQIPLLVDNIVPAANRIKSKGLAGEALIADAIKENVRQSMSDLVRRSTEVEHLIQAGRLRVVGAVYNLETGTVEWL
ncbi:MAG: carbonic anhydrase [Magnetococcales bacterium]|nr:carbonic anhydrase [Magnetococcales bacterium]